MPVGPQANQRCAHDRHAQDRQCGRAKRLENLRKRDIASATTTWASAALKHSPTAVEKLSPSARTMRQAPTLQTSALTLAGEPRRGRVGAAAAGAAEWLGVMSPPVLHFIKRALVVVNRVLLTALPCEKGPSSSRPSADAARASQQVHSRGPLPLTRALRGGAPAERVGRDPRLVRRGTLSLTVPAFLNYASP